MTALSVHSCMLGRNVRNVIWESEDEARVCWEREQKEQEKNTVYEGKLLLLQVQIWTPRTGSVHF